MGLDIYVGSLTRYYLGAWETIVQQEARQRGVTVHVVRPAPPKAPILRRILNFLKPRRDQGPFVRGSVTRWQRALESAAGTGTPFTWNETVDSEYFTDKPGWEWYGALLLWAAHEQEPSEPWPAILHAWDEDPAFKKVEARPTHDYPHLLNDVEIWLPIDLAQPLETTDPFGNDTVVGSSHALLRELQLLNGRTWNATDDQVAGWRAAESTDGHEGDARVGFSIVYRLCQLAVQHRLPMKLDY